MEPGYQKAFRTFKKNIEKRFKEQVKKVVLFGSAARGEMTRESDIDVLIVLDKVDDKIEKEISNIAFDAGESIRVIIVPIILSNKSYEDMLNEKYPFIMNIEREGLAIA
ncbi:MAG: nucleotidyltransferase domain-containing protein [Candidatus Hydrothermarchaeales archaeon]